MRLYWRRGPESNRARRICNPLHNRFATAPCEALDPGQEPRSFHSQRAAWLRIEKDSIFEVLPFEFGAGKRSRTVDLNLGKVALYQLSYSRLASHKYSAFFPLWTAPAFLTKALRVSA